MPPPTGALRIGEFARRVGVSAELLRAWERRYGLLKPVRSAGGFRLYTDEDAERVARMKRALDSGLSAAEAAGSALAIDSEQPAENLFEDARARLLQAVTAFDETALQAVLDDSLAAFGLEPFLDDLVLPALEEVGRRWEADTLNVGHEHFASILIRGRLLALARLWGRGQGPLAVLACVPGESHDIGLLAFGLVLRSHGWRVLFLGADTPIPTLAEAVRATEPELAVLHGFHAELFQAQATALDSLSGAVRLVLSGPGATPEVGRRFGLSVLPEDPVGAANTIANREI
jgi:DNA-binding transcriptional MerR regulator